MAEGIELNDLNYKIIPRNTSNADCTESGFSTFGRYDESINSTNKIWFSEDKFEPENVFSDTNIKNLDIANGKVTHINVENNGVLHKVAVEKVILAAGSLNTPKILLDSGYKNKQLGHNLKLHPVSGVAGKFSEEQKPWAGTMQGIYSDDNLFRKNNYGYLLEGLPMHPSLFFPFFPNNNDKFDDFVKSYNYWSGSIVLTSDTSSGSIINKNPKHLWDYKLNDFDHTNLIHGIVNLRMHPSPEHGVTDLDGKVHGLENVYIVDGSTFPRCSGVNPMITIQSLSHFLVSKL